MRRRPAELGRRHHSRQRRHCPLAGLRQGRRAPGGATYKLSSFAAFNVKGWSFSGDNKLPILPAQGADVPGALECDSSCRGIIGSFIEYVSLADGSRYGTAEDYGTDIVKLTQ